MSDFHIFAIIFTIGITNFLVRHLVPTLSFYNEILGVSTIISNSNILRNQQQIEYFFGHF